jgi:uncharacterized protein (DUF736 family)
MAYEMRAGQGSLFKNDQKTTDKHPNLKGRVMLPNGEVRWASGWDKYTEAGEKWISLSIGELCQQQSGGQAVAAPARVVAVDDDIPF